jgi:hypothetical protein
MEGRNPSYSLFSDKCYLENLDILTFMNLIAKLTYESPHSKTLALLVLITTLKGYFVIEVSFLNGWAGFFMRIILSKLEVSRLKE